MTSTTIHVRLPQPLYEALKAQAVVNDISTSAQVVQALGLLLGVRAHVRQPPRRRHPSPEQLARMDADTFTEHWRGCARCVEKWSYPEARDVLP